MTDIGARITLFSCVRLRMGRRITSSGHKERHPDKNKTHQSDVCQHNLELISQCQGSTYKAANFSTDSN